MNEEKNYGVLCDYQTGDDIRPATASELARSIAAEFLDAGLGLFEMGNHTVYVNGCRASLIDEEHGILSVGDEFLSEEAIAVRDASAPEDLSRHELHRYWLWLSEQL